MGNMGIHTNESREAANQAKRRTTAILKEFGFKPPLKAIREYCLDCQGEGESGVRNCHLPDCPLWPYRMGRRPQERDLQVAQISPAGMWVGHIHLREARAGGAK